MEVIISWGWRRQDHLWQGLSSAWGRSHSDPLVDGYSSDGLPEILAPVLKCCNLELNYCPFIPCKQESRAMLCVQPKLRAWGRSGRERRDGDFLKCQSSVQREANQEEEKPTCSRGHQGSYGFGAPPQKTDIHCSVEWRKWPLHCIQIEENSKSKFEETLTKYRENWGRGHH